MKINLVEGGPINMKFIENTEFCDMIKNTYGVTIIPTIDENVFDPRDAISQVKMKKVIFGKFSYAILVKLNAHNGEEPLDEILDDMFVSFMKEHGIERGDVIVSYGIFTLANMVEMDTFRVKTHFYIRCIINDDINAEYAKILNAEAELELLNSVGDNNA